MNIKFGQGLPITKSLVNNGTLNIEFDYSIGRTVGTVPSTATGIEEVMIKIGQNQCPIFLCSPYLPQTKIVRKSETHIYVAGFKPAFFWSG